MPNCQHTGLPTYCCAHCINGLPKQLQVSPSQPRQTQPKEPWRSGAKRVYKPGFPNSPLKELGYDDGSTREVVTNPDRVVCSFCGKPTSHIQSTKGIGDLEISREVETVSTDPLVTTEKVTVKAHKVVACPNCAHKIKPITHKVRQSDGSLKDEIKMMNSTGYDEG